MLFLLNVAMEETYESTETSEGGVIGPLVAAFRVSLLVVVGRIDMLTFDVVVGRSP